MKIVLRLCSWSLFFLLVSFAGGSALALAAEGDALKNPVLKEMPVLTGHLWQKMTHDGKTAFVWGVGHVVTIEKYVVGRHPELKRSDFTAKLAEGLAGVPMDSIVKGVDDYYGAHPSELDTPVMKVIWREMVKPKLTTGIADKPLTGETATK